MNTSPSATANNPLLHLLKNTTVSMVASDSHDLTGRQLGVFLTVYLEQGDHTVRGMAAKLNVSKPAITRALDRLTEFDLVRREDDPKDRRSVLVLRTQAGAAYLRKIASFLRDSYKNGLHDAEKAA